MDRRTLHRRLLVLILGRAFFVLLLALFMVLFHQGQVFAFASPAIRLLAGSVLATLAVTSVYLVLWRWLGRGLYWFAFVQIQLDLVLWAVIVMVTGGVNSYFTFLFHLSLVLSAVYLEHRGVVFTLVLSITAYVLAVVSGLLDWFPSLGSVLEVNAQPDVGDLVVALTLDVGSMVLVALLSWVLALQVSRTGRSLVRTREIFEDLHRLNQVIVSLLPSGLVTTDESGTIRSVNPAACRILGLAEREAVGRPLGDVLGEASSAVEQGSTFFETSIERDGVETSLELSTAPLTDGAGNVVGAIVHVMDVTEQKRMRRRLVEFEKYRALGDLAVGLAHEIRNPLGSISGSIELVKESGELGPEDRRLLSIVQRETEKIGRHVTSLFNLARPPAPHMDTHDGAELMREVVTLFRGDPAMSDITVKTDLEEGLRVVADRDQLGQVVMNLLRNAADASREDGGRVRVEAERVEGGWVEIRVADSGPGVDPELLDRIFDPYFTTKGYGIGVGLALCRSIVERHGGTIDLSNRDGGAVATVRLPPGGEDF